MRKWFLVIHAALFGVAGLLFAACGAAASGSNTTVLNLEATNFRTLPPVVSTAPPLSLVTGSSVTGDPTGSTLPAATYTIKPGDAPLKIAKMYSISLDALNNANADTVGYDSFYPGLQIKIPAGAIAPASTTTVFVLKPGCTQGTYVVKGGDSPGSVAGKFGVTRTMLDNANRGLKGYGAFLVGIKLTIPAKAGTSGC
jgi:spore germination protein YaaH